MDPTHQCAAGSLCNAPEGKTLGNHKCCKCKKVVHSVFCAKEVETLSSNIKDKFIGETSLGMNHEACLKCIKEEEDKLPQSPPAAASAPAPPDTNDGAAIELSSDDDDDDDDDTPPASNISTTPKATKTPLWFNVKKANNKRRAERKEKEQKSSGPKAIKKRGSRAGKEMDHSIEDRLKIIKVYKKLTGKGMKGEYAKKMGVSTRTITRWSKSKGDLEKAMEEGRGKKKTMFNDDLLRVKMGLKQFYLQNERMPKEQKLPISGEHLDTVFGNECLSHILLSSNQHLILCTYVCSQQVYSQ